MSAAFRALAECIVRCAYCDGEGTYMLDTPVCWEHVERSCEMCGRMGFVFRTPTRAVIRSAFEELGMQVPWREEDRK